jgi:hypothetical protein
MMGKWNSFPSPFRVYYLIFLSIMKLLRNSALLNNLSPLHLNLRNPQAHVCVINAYSLSFFPAFLTYAHTKNHHFSQQEKNRTPNFTLKISTWQILSHAGKISDGKSPFKSSTRNPNLNQAEP